MTGDADRPAAECWRCGLLFDAEDPFCPTCEARNPDAPRRRRRPRQPRRRHEGNSPHLRAFWQVGGVACLLMLLSLAYGVWVGNQNLAELPDREAERRLVVSMAVIGGIDGLIILAAIPMIGTPRRVRPPLEPAVAWLAGFGLLTIALGMNLAYFHLLREYIFQGRELPFDLVEPDIRGPLWLGVVVTVCVMPAVFEELFCRYLLLGHLRPLAGTHGAVWLSAAVFGLMHVFNPLAIPLLTVIGAMFGYARVWSGGLALPILMHAAHNAIVSLIEAGG